MLESNSHSANKIKNEQSRFTLVLKPMPEIALMDPITGALPKNYKKILAEREKNGVSSNNSNKQLAFDNTNANNNSQLKLRPMPEIALLNPVTGKLPKNYKEILAQQSARKAAISDSSDKSADIEFKVSKLETSDKSLSKVGQTLQIDVKKGPRKALFTKPGKSVRPSRGSNSAKLTKTLSTDANESVLLDADETEKQLFLKKKKTFSPAIHKPQPSLNQKNNNRKRSATSTSSLEEFLKLEQLTKTPKSAIKSKRKKSMSLEESIDVIMTKLNENNDMMKSIEKNNIEINDNIKKILQSIQTVDNKNTGSVKNEAGELKENIPVISSNEFASRTNLLVSTLKSNFKKKVLFDVGNDESRSPYIKKKTVTVTKTSTQTPNTMLRSVSKKANEQLLKLQDTPKSAYCHL